MPVTDDEIQERHLLRAISETNSLAREIQACEECRSHDRLPVIGSGHPMADIFLLKHHAGREEIEEGVSFYGRPGAAVLGSLNRLKIDPTTVYGTLCVKCPVPASANPQSDSWLREEFAIVQPRILVVMGEDTLEVVNNLQIPLAKQLNTVPGRVQAFTPSCQALLTPALDSSLDDDAAKRAFWTAFQELGRWHARLPTR